MNISIERQVLRRIVQTSVHPRYHSRLFHTSYIIKSDQPETSFSSSSKSVKGSRKRSLDGIDINSVDLVGPPDPISNIRPMVYSPPQGTNRESKVGDNSGQNSISTSDRATQNPHPYSAHEFHRSSFSAKQQRIGQRRPIGLGFFSIYRQYLDYVCDRVEESEMKLRIAKLTTDKTTQRFWRDNNTRFTRDMQAWSQQQQHHQIDDQINLKEKSLKDENQIKLPTKNNNPSQELIIEGPSSESDFYATWLKANAKRNKAYNVLVWKQAFEQVRLGFKVNVWRSWLNVLRTLEGR